MELMLLVQDALPTLPSDTGAWLVILATVVTTVAGVIKRYMDIKLERAKAKIDTQDNQIVRLQGQLNGLPQLSKILVVDDNPVDYELLKTTLEFSGLAHKLVWCDTITKGYISMREDDISFVLCDMKMATNGQRFLSMVKSDPRTRNIPVIVISASVPESIDIYQLGAIGYLAKPVQISVLLQTLSKHGFSWELKVIE